MNWLSDPRIRVYLNEMFVQRKLALTFLILTNFLMLVAAYSWPKGFVADTTILAAERNVLQPLMQGTAATTDVIADRARLARELINGRKVMNQVIVEAGWASPDASETFKNDIVSALNKRTTITNVGRNLIRIQYRDTDAERTYRTTKAIADIFIQESINAKAAESESAFNFIDKQTQEYQLKLADMEERLKQFRIANLDVRPGADGDVNNRMNALQMRIETSRQELKEADIRKRSLEKQLSGEAEVATAISREGQYRQRIAELTNQLETLRLSYHDTYPDIINIRHQIEDLKRAIDEDKRRREAAKAAGQITIDDTVINNPMYQQLKRDLSQTQITIDMLQARISEANQQLNALLERGKKIHGGEATLAELTRDYQVTRDIYQDLLRRRENARVSMNMDRENQGVTFKIQEPAILPLYPSGPRFIHFILLGLVLGLAVPIALVIALVKFDPRIRHSMTLADKYHLPLTVVIPHLWTPDEIDTVKHQIETGTLIVAGTFGVITVAVATRAVGII